MNNFNGTYRRIMAVTGLLTFLGSFMQVTSASAAAQLRDDFGWSDGTIAVQSGGAETIWYSGATGWGWGGYAAGGNPVSAHNSTNQQLTLPTDAGSYIYTIFSSNGDGTATDSIDLTGAGAAFRLMHDTHIEDTKVRWLIRDTAGDWHISSLSPGDNLNKGNPYKKFPMSWGLAWYTWESVDSSVQMEMNELDDGGALAMAYAGASTPDLSAITGFGIYIDSSATGVPLGLYWVDIDEHLELMPFAPDWGGHILELRDGKYYFDFSIWGGGSLGAFRIHDGEKYGGNLQAPGWGKGWLSAFRSKYHNGTYNPTQGGADEWIGAVTEMWYADGGSSVNSNLTRIEYGPFQVATMGLGHMCQYGDLAVEGTDLFPYDNDGMPETGLSQKDEIMSEFHASGWREDISTLITDTNTGAFFNYQQYDYSDVPHNMIQQFNETAGEIDAKYYNADISPLLPGAQATTQLTPTENWWFWGFRLNLNEANYEYAWYPRTSGGHEVFKCDEYLNWRKPTDEGEVWYMMMAESDSNMNANAIMCYYPPWSLANQNNIAGIDETTGEILYTENRLIEGGSSGYAPGWRASLRMKSNGLNDYTRFWEDSELGTRNFTKHDFAISNTGVLNPGYGIPGSYERVRYEWIMIFGTVQSCLDAKAEIDSYYTNSVNRINQPPVFSSVDITRPSVGIDEPYIQSIAGEASDPESDPITYEIISGPDWLSLTTNGMLTGTPALTNMGINEFLIKVSDDQSSEVRSAKLSILVEPEILFSDDFESAGFFDGGWTVTSAPGVPSGVGVGGSYGAELVQDEVITKALSTVGETGLKLSYDRRCNTTFEANDFLVVEWSPDGSIWNVLEQTQDSVFSNQRWNLPAEAENQSGFQFRFRMTAAQLNEYGWIDNVLVSRNVAPAFTSDLIVAADGKEAVPYAASIAGNANDVDGDSLTFSKTSGPAWLVLDPDGTLSGTPLALDVGLNSWDIEVSDGVYVDSAVLNIYVEGGPVNLFADNFDSGNFSAGGWTVSGVCEVTTNKQVNGDYYAQLNESDAISKAISTVDMSEIKLSYTRRCNETLDSGEFLVVEWSPDGSSWIELERTAQQVDATMMWSLPQGAGNRPGFEIRFRMIANKLNEWGWVDDVSVDAIRGYERTENNLPVFVSNPVVKAGALEGAAYIGSLANDVSDADYDLLTFAKLSGPSWLSVDSAGTLSGTPSDGDTGLNSWEVEVTDGLDDDFAMLEIFVTNVNKMTDTGVPYSWLDTFYPGLETPEQYEAVALSDSDGDGFSAEQEYIAVTGPTNPASYFHVESTSFVDVVPGFALWWSSHSGRVYSVWGTTNLNLPFEPWATNIVYPTASYTDTVHSAEDNVFFNINVEME